MQLLKVELDSPRIGSAGIVPALIDSLLLYILRAWLEEQGRPVPGAGPRPWETGPSLRPSPPYTRPPRPPGPSSPSPSGSGCPAPPSPGGSRTSSANPPWRT
nr:cupin domain-containing protein [Streptomyces alboflavus]